MSMVFKILNITSFTEKKKNGVIGCGEIRVNLLNLKGV